LGCFVQYRVAFYVAGEVDALVNAFMLLDGYFQFMAKRLARATPFEIYIYPHDSVEDALSSLEETMSYKPITLHVPGKDLPLKWCQAQPAVSKKILCFFFEPDGAKELSLVLTGNTWNFRDDLEKAGVSGARNENGGYYRFLKNIDVTDVDSKQMVLGMFDILHKQAARVVVDPEPEEGTPVAEFLAELKLMPYLHFA